MFTCGFWVSSSLYTAGRRFLPFSLLWIPTQRKSAAIQLSFLQPAKILKMPSLGQMAQNKIGHNPICGLMWQEIRSPSQVQHCVAGSSSCLRKLVWKEMRFPHLLCQKKEVWDVKQQKCLCKSILACPVKHKGPHGHPGGAFHFEISCRNMKSPQNFCYCRQIRDEHVINISSTY